MFKNPFVGLTIAIVVKLVVYVVVRTLLEREVSDALKSYSEFGIVTEPEDKE